MNKLTSQQRSFFKTLHFPTGRVMPLSWNTREYDFVLILIGLSCAVSLFGACGASRTDHYVIVSPQRSDQPTGFSNNPSTVVVPGLPTRYAVGFDDHTDVFDAAGHRVAGSSAMGFAYSDDSAETWRRYRIPGPSSTEVVTLIGSASLAVGEIAADYPVYYAAAAITGSGDRPNRIYVACSANRGASFDTWTSVSADQAATVSSPSLAVDKSTGNLHLAFVANQGSPDAAIEQWDGTYAPERTSTERAAQPCMLNWTLIQRISEENATDRPNVRHPIIRIASASGRVLYLAYELRRAVADPNQFTDRELVVKVKFRPTPSRSWIDTVPVGRCCSFMHPFRFRSHSLDLAGAPSATGMNQMDFAMVHGRTRSKGIIIWSGVTPADTQHWPSIHYEEFIVHWEHLQHEGPPRISFSQGEGMAFLPTAAGIGDEEAQGEYGVRAASWYFQSASGGQISLMGARSRTTGLTWDEPRNLSLIESSTASMPLCATSSGEWGNGISSLMFKDIPSLDSQALVIYMSSRGVPCTDNGTVDNRVRYQEVAAIRWQIERQRRWCE